MIAALQTQTQSTKKQSVNNENELQIFKHCKKLMCYHLKKNKDKRPLWYNNILANQAKSKADKKKKVDR